MYSVIIPTSNAGNNIFRLLSSLSKQTIPLQIIVIDSSSSDNTIGITKPFGIQTIPIRAENFDHGGTRNLAARYAHGDIIVFLTQDIIPVDDFSLERLIMPFAKDKKIGAAFGRQLPHPNAKPFARHLRIFNYPEKSYLTDLKSRQDYGIRTSFLSNSFAAYRRKALEEIGWFKEKMIMGEDMHAAAKMLLAGYRIAYVADAMVYHSHNYRVLEDFKRYFDIGVFHRREEWIVEEFGGAGGEGKKYISSQLFYLLRTGKYYLFPEFVIRNGMKFAGFTLGRYHRILPRRLAEKCSMHKNWWKYV